MLKYYFNVCGLRCRMRIYCRDKTLFGPSEAFWPVDGARHSCKKPKTFPQNRLHISLQWNQRVFKFVIKFYQTDTIITLTLFLPLRLLNSCFSLCLSQTCSCQRTGGGCHWRSSCITCSRVWTRSAWGSTASASPVEPKLWGKRSASSRGRSRTSGREAPAWGGGSRGEEETGVLLSPITRAPRGTMTRGGKAAARRLVEKVRLGSRVISFVCYVNMLKESYTLASSPKSSTSLLLKIWVSPRRPWPQKWVVGRLSSSPRRTKKWLDPLKGRDALPRTGTLATPGQAWARVQSAPHSSPCCPPPGRGRDLEAPGAAPAVTVTVTMTTCCQVQSTQEQCIQDIQHRSLS